ncbi:hypothetical protein CPB85DRAFT_1430122 [Mucidula mucida]|nr:hypothetical protein CPB85DRAFT_1430122 [Mucidula mucida]
MSILLAGKPALRVVRLLHEANKSFLLASRKRVIPEPSNSTVSPPWADGILESMVPFIDLAMQKGVKRFVFFSPSGIGAGENLITLGVDYFVMRPTFFIENFVVMCSKLSSDRLEEM